ncbi:hypothetical protein TWF281_008668 [Arthrobotrys megalospora]
MAESTRGYRPAYWIVKRGGRRIDPAVDFFQEGDNLEFIGSSMEQDHTLRLRNYGPGIGYRINRGAPAPDNPRIELRYANLQPALDLLALAEQLEQLAADIDAAQAEPPVDEVTRMSVRQRDESEHNFQFWDNILGDSPERVEELEPINSPDDAAEGNNVIELIPLPSDEDYGPVGAQNQNRGEFELMPVQGQREEDDIEAQRGPLNDELNVAFRGDVNRTY